MNDLFSLLERQIQFIRKQPDHRLFLALPGLVDFVQREPRLRAIADSIALEFESALAKYSEVDRCHANEVLTLFEGNAEWTSKIYGESARKVGKEADDRLKMPREQLTKFAREGGRCDASPLLFRRADSSAAESAISYLRGFFEGLELKGVPESNRSQYLQSVQRLAEISYEHQRAFFKYLHVMTASAGASWKMLKDLAEGLCPAAPEVNQGDGLSIEAVLGARAFKQRTANADVLLGLDRSQGASRIRGGHRSKADNALGLFLEDMALRIGIYLSHRALILRFKTKCEMFLAESLLERIDSKPGKAEEMLTLAAAEFLFDRGLNPLFNAQVVRLCPDLFDPRLPHALYIEAKQYREDNPRAKVEKAAWQMWDTWHELDSQHQVREAFLLVFRRSGPLVTFDESASLEGRTLYPLLVDIAPMDERGSRARWKPVHITAAELLPRKEESSTEAPIA
ncbi:MAG: hypothetical protein ABSF35_19490 [Polyangia bacterium]